MSANFLFLHVNEWADFETTDALPLPQGYILANLKKHGYSGHIIGKYKNRPLSPNYFHIELKRLRPKAIRFSVYEENLRRVRVWAHIAMKQYKEAEEIANDPRLGTSLQTMNLRVKLASLLELPVEEYLQSPAP